MSETGVAIKVLGDTQPLSQWEVTGELRRRLIRAFLEENVRAPFPSHVVAGATS
jgi:small conductance mechanosensitive channel